MCKRLILRSLCFIPLLLLTQCASMAASRPVVNLAEYGATGLLIFRCEREGVLDEMVTQQFLERLTGFQHGIRILELGTTDDVLREVGHRTMIPEAIRAIGDRYGINSLFAGTLTVEDVKTRINLSAILTSLSVRAEVEATLEVRLFETESGATMWTKSVNRKRSVTEVHAHSDGAIWFDARDPGEAYGELVDALARGATYDFRVRRRR